MCQAISRWFLRKFSVACFSLGCQWTVVIRLRERGVRERGVRAFFREAIAGAWEPRGQWENARDPGPRSPVRSIFASKTRWSVRGKARGADFVEGVPSALRSPAVARWGMKPH